MSSKNVKIVLDNEKLLINELKKKILAVSVKSITENGVFVLGLSGGSLIKFICDCICNLNVDLSKWKFIFIDERLVSTEDKESTFGAYLKGLCETPITSDQFLSVNLMSDAALTAKDYERQLKDLFPNCDWPSIDLLLLGLGPDGHTASLFPGHSALNETSCWVTSVIDSPKPPPRRVTLTLPVINQAKNCVFVASGQSKASIIKRILKDNDDLPAARVKPISGNLIWILDKMAASEL